LCLPPLSRSCCSVVFFAIISLMEERARKEKVEIKKPEIQWDHHIPLYNRFIAKDILVAFGLPTLIIALWIGSMYLSDIRKGYSVSFDGFQYALGMVIILILGTMLLLWILYGNRFETRFIINSKGVKLFLRAGTRKKSRIVSFLLIFAGMASKKPGFVGMGLMSQSQESFSARWKDIYSYQPYPGIYCIVLRNSWRKLAILHCSKENYQQVLQTIDHYMLPRSGSIKKELRLIRKERIKNLYYMPFIALFAFFMTAIYDYDFDSRAVVYLVAFWVFLGVIVDLDFKPLFSYLGYVGIILIWIIFSISFIDSSIWSYDYPRWLFFTLGSMGMILLLYLQMRRTSKHNKEINAIY
jgi:hypothetical protein